MKNYLNVYHEIHKSRKKYSNLLIFALFFFSYFSFFLSLERCLEGEDVCCKKVKWMKKKVIEEAISCILVIILFELMIKKKISKLHIIHFIIVFLSFYSASHGIDFDDHGYYNIKFFFIIVIFILFLLSIINYLLSIKNKKIIIICFFSSLILLYAIKNIINYYSDCNGWEKGLNNTSINNDIKKYGCQIQIPKLCLYKIGKFFLDRNKITSLDCNKQSLNSRKKLLEFSNSPYINENTSHIGYPLINKEEKLFLNKNYYSLKSYISENLINMNNFSLLQSLSTKKPEISIDFSKNTIGQININLNFNETLSRERRKLENLNNPFSKNILILYIDSVSRAYSIRQLKKTLKFFEKFMSYKGNYNKMFPSENFHSFQFFKYHSFKHFTTGNYPILFYGNHRNKRNKYITLHLKKNGYITGYSADNCFIDFVRSYHDFTFDDIYDHQYVICDPNKIPPSSELKCFYGRLHFEYMFEYMEQFWKKYKDNRKFSLLLTNFAHEGSIEMLKYIDNRIYEYFNKLFNDNLLKDTSIFLLSDHGVAIPSIYYLTQFFKYEKDLPMLYLLINDRKNVSYELQYNHLYENQQTFITGFDIYDTIIHLIYGSNYGTKATKGILSKKGKSLFTKIDQKKRSPKKYKPMTKKVCK